MKKSKKGVDKWGKVWYSNKAVAAVSTAAKRNEKKFLTDATWCGKL